MLGAWRRGARLRRTFSIFLGLGYAATSTYDDDLFATIDQMTVSLGARLRF